MIWQKQYGDRYSNDFDFRWKSDDGTAVRLRVRRLPVPRGEPDCHITITWSNYRNNYRNKFHRVDGPAFYDFVTYEQDLDIIRSLDDPTLIDTMTFLRHMKWIVHGAMLYTISDKITPTIKFDTEDIVRWIIANKDVEMGLEAAAALGLTDIKAIADKVRLLDNL